LELMSIWQWLREYFDAQYQATLKAHGDTPYLAALLGAIADGIAL
jgi:hypothetical protein